MNGCGGPRAVRRWTSSSPVASEASPTHAAEKASAAAGVWGIEEERQEDDEGRSKVSSF